MAALLSALRWVMARLQPGGRRAAALLILDARAEPFAPVIIDAAPPAPPIPAPEVDVPAPVIATPTELPPVSFAGHGRRELAALASRRWDATKVAHYCAAQGRAPLPLPAFLALLMAALDDGADDDEPATLPACAAPPPLSPASDGRPHSRPPLACALSPSRAGGETRL